MVDLIGTDTQKATGNDENTRDVIKSLTDRLKKIYKNTYIHPYEVLKNRYNFSTTEKRDIRDTDVGLPDHHILMAEPNFEVNINFANEINQDSIDEEYGPPFLVEYSQINSGSFASAPNWNQDRIDQRTLPLDSTYQPVNPGNSRITANKIHIYVVDTGINPNHDAFDSITVSVDFPGSSARDCNGHGTHVASTVAGIASGVLSAVPKTSGKYEIVLHSVKVLGCDGSGTTSDVLNGLIWIYNNVQYPAIISMSLGSSRSFSIDNVVQLLINDKNIPVIAAAGNDASDACTVSPGGGTNVITVGSTNILDTFSSFSNKGSCVDIMAPGEDITGAYYANPSAYFRLSGTSMATPHVSGAVAGMTLELLSTTQISGNLTTIAKSSVDVILSRSTRNIITSLPQNTPNSLLYYGPNNIQTVTPPPTIIGSDSVGHFCSIIICVILPIVIRQL